MSTAFAKRFIKEWKCTSSAFGITGGVSRNSWVDDVFTLNSPAKALKIRAYPAPAG